MTLFLLAGDIGGTNTRLALYSAPENLNSEEKRLSAPVYTPPLFLKKYVNEIHLPTDNHSWEHEILLPFLQEACEINVLPNDNSASIVACLAVAGPVDTIRNRVTMTNILRPNHSSSSLVLDGGAIESSSLGLLQCIRKCFLVNDFIGQGYGLLTLNDNDTTRIVELIPGSFQRLNRNGPKACVGAGTGLGQCYLTPSFTPRQTTEAVDASLSYTCYPSEGGHVDYAPRRPYLHQLHTYLKHKYNEQYRISVERVVSGRGIVDVYEFLVQTFPQLVDEDVHKAFLLAEDRGRFLGEQANRDFVEKKVGLFQLAMDIVMEAYGAEVANAALKFLPTGELL